MKVSEGQKGWIRKALWIASLAWAAYFLLYGIIVMPALLDILKWVWPVNNFYVWTTMVFYVLVILTAVIIFFWFFTRLWQRK